MPLALRLSERLGRIRGAFKPELALRGGNFKLCSMWHVRRHVVPLTNAKTLDKSL